MHRAARRGWPPPDARTSDWPDERFAPSAKGGRQRIAWSVPEVPADNSLASAVEESLSVLSHFLSQGKADNGQVIDGTNSLHHRENNNAEAQDRMNCISRNRRFSVANWLANSLKTGG
jgi:hypothetical protein